MTTKHISKSSHTFTTNVCVIVFHEGHYNSYVFTAYQFVLWPETRFLSFTKICLDCIFGVGSTSAESGEVSTHNFWVSLAVACSEVFFSGCLVFGQGLHSSRAYDDFGYYVDFINRLRKKLHKWLSEQQKIKILHYPLPERPWARGVVWHPTRRKTHVNCKIKVLKVYQIY